MSGQVTVYTSDGIPLADLDVNVFRSWALNMPGEATFTMSTKDSKCREEFLQFGNRLLIQRDDLPDWVGIMDTPRSWTYGKVECRAVGAEAWFDWRVTYIGPIRDTMPNVMRKIIDDCNSWGGSQMGYGEMGNNTIMAGAALGGRARDHLDRLVEEYNIDWSVTSRIAKNNRLALIANLYEGMRGDWTNLVLNNVNSQLDDPVLVTDGAIFNHVFYYSEPGEGGGRRVGNARDYKSQKKYDLRQLAEQGAGMHEDGLEIAAYMRLQDTKEPAVMITPSVLNVGDAWQNLRLGNVIYWDSDYVGFDKDTLGMSSTLRIVGMEFDDAAQVVTLVTEMVAPYYARKESVSLSRLHTGEAETK